MLSSTLTSIGHPEPLEVRVFGASESPGPYALFLGLVLTQCLCAAAVARSGAQKLGWIGLSTFLAIPFLLSGVRSALLGVALCAVLLALVRARGITRILLLGFLAGAWILLNSLISRFGPSSTILTADRYTQVSGQDHSLVARLHLLTYLRNPTQYIVGNPQAPPADNLFIDVMIRYGIVPALAMFLLFAAIAFMAVGDLAGTRNEVVSLCALFVVTQSLTGSLCSTPCSESS